MEEGAGEEEGEEGRGEVPMKWFESIIFTLTFKLSTAKLPDSVGFVAQPKLYEF